MPNRWKRVNGKITPIIVDESVREESKQVFEDYSRKDDFGYGSSPTGEYTVSGTWSAVATGSNFLSGTTAGNSGGFLTLGAGNVVDPTKDFNIKFRGQLTDDDEELFAFIGFAETAPTDADPPVEADDYCYFRLVETTGDANWFAVCGEDVGGSGAETAVDTGVAVDLNPHTFEIKKTTGSVQFKIDGNVVADITTNLPVVAGSVLAKVTTGDTDAKGITADVLNVINSRA